MADPADASRFVAPFAALTAADTDRAGGKGANLGELERAGLPVPPGFVILVDAYRDAMDAAGARGELRTLLADVRADDADDVRARAARGRELVQAAAMPDQVRAAVLAAYRDLGPDVRVAVRSSATAEDSGDTSFAGMHATFTNVAGDDALLTHVDRLLDVAVRRSRRRLPGRRGASPGSRRSPSSCSRWRMPIAPG